MSDTPISHVAISTLAEGFRELLEAITGEPWVLTPLGKVAPTEPSGVAQEAIADRLRRFVGED